MDSGESFLKKLETDLETGNTLPDDRRGILHSPKMKPVRTDWETASAAPAPDPFMLTLKKRDQQKSLFKKLFIASCAFAVVAGGFFAYSLFTGKARLTGENVDVIVTSKTFADSGEEVNVKVSIANKNSVPMEFSKLSFSYPLGTARDANAVKEVSRDLGTIGAGETRDETFTFSLFGEQGTEKNFAAMVEYRLQGSNAIFETNGGTKLTLRSSIANLVISAPDALLPGQNLPIQLTVSGNTASTVKNALLIAKYPDECNYMSSDVPTTLDNQIWYLGDLEAGIKKEINVVLSCSGLTNIEKNIEFTLGNQSPTNERLVDSVYTSGSHLVKLSAAFLATTIYVNGKQFDGTVALPPNRESSIEIDWRSTVDTTITAPSIRLALSGSAYDASKVRVSTGYFDTNNDTVLWTGNESADLKTVEPGQSGRVGFIITPKSGLSATATLDLGVTVNGILDGGITQSLVNASVAKIPLTTDFQLVPKILYHSGPLSNTGPIPLQTGKETTYTIVWQLSNSTNEVSNAIVKTTLPTGITWKNVVAPVSDASNIVYNTVSREIVWNAGQVPVGQNKKSIAFKIGIIPVKSQIGTVMDITGNLLITGTDSVTKTTLSQSKRPLNTRLVGDTSTVGSDGKVAK
jgi:hypothetical protein